MEVKVWIILARSLKSSFSTSFLFSACLIYLYFGTRVSLFFCILFIRILPVNTRRFDACYADYWAQLIDTR